MRLLSALTVSLLFGSGCVVRAPEPRALDNEQVTVPVGDLERVELNINSGTLEVEGDPELNQVVLDVTYVVTAFNEENARKLGEDLDWSHEVRQRTLFVETSARLWKEFQGEAWIDLKVRIPASLALKVATRTRKTVISNIEGPVSVEDEVGSLVLEDLKGSLNVKDGGRGMEITSVRGPVEINDGPGRIILKEIGSDVVINDSSGSIEIEGVEGSVTIDDGSGSITVDRVTGNFEVAHNSSGRISYENVQGDVKIPDRP